MQGRTERLPVSQFRLTDIPAITKQRVHLVVDQRPDAQPLVVPTLVARGRQPGKTLLVIGAVHGDEYESPVAIQDIFEDLVPTRMRGSFVGVPVVTIYAEMMGEGRCRPVDVERARQGIRQVLAYLGITEGPYPSVPPRYVLEMPEHVSGHLQSDHPSPASGIFVPAVGLWDPVEQGQSLGQVRDADGTVLAHVRAARRGRVLFLRTLPRVRSGDALAFVLALPDSTP